MRHRILASLPFFVFGLLAALSVNAASFTPLGDLPGGFIVSKAYAVSADGTTVVGSSYDANGERAFRWTASAGMQNLGLLPAGDYTVAWGVSGDGSVIVGSGAHLSGTTESFRWTNAGGMQGLGWLPTGDYYSVALGVSVDGSTIAGHSNVQTGFANELAYRWTVTGGMENLGALPYRPGTEGSEAYGISGDGSVIVGTSQGLVGSSNGPQAFRWTQAEGMVALTPFVGANNSRAFAASTDGSVIVGSSYVSPRDDAFRWMQTTGMVSLGSVPGGDTSNRALSVSGDGSVIVGHFYGDGIADPQNEDTRTRAFIWSPNIGMQRLLDVLVNQGAAGLSGWTLIQATGVSADGRAVVGWGLNPQGRSEAFVATLSAVPIPAAVWLLGSALGVLGVMRRRAAA